MNKYIDSEKLIAEIERRIESWTTRGKHEPAGQGRDTCVSRVTELSDLLSFVTSLQQEQPNLDDVKREWYNKGYLKGRKDANIPARELGLPKSYDIQEQPEVDEQEYGPYARQYPKSKVSQEQPEVDLENKFADFLEKENAYVDDNNKISYYNGSSFDHTSDIYPIARHFYELGLNARKEE